mgnify:CR=1 FL=1
MNWFRIKSILKLGGKSRWMHRLRSMLTTLGIIFGVCSVVAMLAIGEGASRQAQQQIERLGSTNLIINTVKPPDEQVASGTTSRMNEYGLTYTDAERFYATLPTAQVIVPLRQISQEAWYRNRKLAIEVIGTVPWYPEIASLHILRGRFLTAMDMNYQQAVCVVDRHLAKQLFVFDDPTGQDIKIKGDYYRVVGVVSAAAESAGPADQPVSSSSAAGGVAGRIYIPITTVKIRFGEIKIQMGGSGAQIEKVQLQQITVKVQSSDQVLVTREIISRLLSKFHKKQDYQIVVPLELLREAARTKRIFSIVLGSIAAISLLVGGIGIMNIMLATVNERTREIGIRRALGARKKDIIVQFLSETVLLTLMGGVLGIVLGSIIPYLVTYFGDMPTVITGSSLILAFGISGAIGIAFGLYPAYRAANMDPIESLRHE